MIDYNDYPVTSIPNFKGGEKQTDAQMFFDGVNRIMKCKLVPGASIGMHKHETSSEIMYYLSGTGKVICDGVEEKVSPNKCHYCKKGSTHTLINDGNEDLIFFAVVPEQ